MSEPSAMGLPDRFWAKVALPSGPDGCWLWFGSNNGAGYGQLRFPAGQKYAHRLSYEALVGPIPNGMFIDHLCRTPACVRPDHLEPVSPRENVRRGNAPLLAGLAQSAKTHCPAGHLYDEENTYYRDSVARKGRCCRICYRRAVDKYQAKTRRS